MCSQKQSKYLSLLFNSQRDAAGLSSVATRDTKTGDPARLRAQVAGRWGLIK
jgi:hypothetical protein